MTGQGESTHGGHGLHIRAIHLVRAAGFIKAAVDNGTITVVHHHPVVTKGIPSFLIIRNLQ